MGFTNLYGIELQSYAVQRSKEMFKNINIIQGSGFDIPYKNDFFDVVMTNGVLIHIKPENLSVIMNEMIRCTKQYIIGFEYYAEELQDIPYRGNIGYLWKGNYAQEFVKINSSLKIIGKKIYPYINQAESGNQDIHYLLEK